MPVSDTGLDELRRRAMDAGGPGAPHVYAEGVHAVLHLLQEPTCSYAPATLPRPCRLRPGHLGSHNVSEAP